MKLNCAGARADCKTRGTAAGAGRAKTGCAALRGADALGASWIDMSWVSLKQPQAALGHRRVNHGDAASGAGATIGAGAACEIEAKRPANSAKDVVERQGLEAGDDRRSSDDAPPRQLGAAGRRANGRGLIDCISGVGAYGGAHTRPALQLPCRTRHAARVCSFSRPRRSGTGVLRRCENAALQGRHSLSARGPQAATHSGQCRAARKRPELPPADDAAGIKGSRHTRVGWPPAGAGCTPRAARPGSARCWPARQRCRPSSPGPRR